MELIKMEFRAETITYSKAKRRELKNRETYLQEKLDALDIYVIGRLGGPYREKP